MNRTVETQQQVMEFLAYRNICRSFKYIISHACSYYIATIGYIYLVGT